jgi:hypothetical protein
MIRWARGTHGVKDKMRNGNVCGKLKVTVHLENPGIDERISLKWILKK